MNENLSIELIVNKIATLQEYTEVYFDKYVGELSPAGKYQLFLLNASIIIQRLKDARVFQSGTINTELLLEMIIAASCPVFEKFKAEHAITYNTYEHPVFIIKNEVNKRNLQIFKKNIADIKKDARVLISVFNFEIDNKMHFRDIYLNIVAYPFFSVIVPSNKLDSEKSTFVKFINNDNDDEFNRFDSIMVKLINDISTKLNEDIFLMKNVSNKQSNNKNCYVATLAYKDINHPQVEYLRNYRDEFLIHYYIGKIFVKYYYRYSPKIVKYLKPFEKINILIKKGLDLFIFISKRLN